MAPANEIDAAIAQVFPGKVSASILNIGGISSLVTAPIVGMKVRKMGRTTCLTEDQIVDVGVNITIHLEAGPKGFANFTNQFIVGEREGGGNEVFSRQGDDGAVIVTTGPCPMAVGMVVEARTNARTGESSAIATPISAIMQNSGVSMVGSCSAAVASDASQQVQERAVSDEEVASATMVRDRHETELMSVPGAVGTGIGLGDRAGEPAIDVFVRKMTPEAKAFILQDEEGVQVRAVSRGELVAF